MSSILRFLLEGCTQASAGDILDVPAESGHHMVNVLRLRVGDPAVAFDGHGRHVDVEIDRASSLRSDVIVRVRVVGEPRAGAASDVANVLLLQGVPKGDKLEHIVRQSTELGARAIWPVFTERAISKVPADVNARRERLRVIAAGACAQSGRDEMPEIGTPRDLDEALSALDPSRALRLVAWEQDATPLQRVLERFPKKPGAVVLIGPEGGLTEREVERARAHGFMSVSLGPRRLRTETVAPVVLTWLSTALGDLSGSAISGPARRD